MAPTFRRPRARARPSGRPPTIAGAAVGFVLAVAGLWAAAGWVLAPTGDAAAATVASGQPGAERIVSYDVALRIEAGGDLAVTETIAYDFGTSSRHGILRHIPVRLRYDDRYDRVYPLRIERVSASEGTPAGYTTEDAGHLKRIRIGDPDRTVTGTHTYTIAYRVAHALNGFEDHDELYWNAVGSEWDVAVEQARVTVEAPATISRVGCFTGPTGSGLACASSSADGTTARFGQAGMGPNESLTVVVALPKGAVPDPVPRLDERWTPARAFAATPGTVGAAGALLAASVAGLVALVWRTGRDRRYAGSGVDVVFGGPGAAEQTVGLLERPITPVEFEPPHGMRPGQVGTLVDERAHPIDVIATIIDLAVRGYLRIEEIPRSGWFGKADWRLTRRHDADDGLKRYERLLLDGLFRDGDEVLLSTLKDTFAARLAKVRDALYADATDERWFAARPDRIRLKWVLIGAAVTVVGAGLTALAAARTHAGLVPVPVVLLGLALMAGSGAMPRRTARGTAALRRVAGFRRFIEESEAERARFAERKNLFSEYLPYAVVFGCTEKWARAFAGLDGELPEVAWYSSSRPFTTSGFTSSMRGFTNATAGTITSTPSGSGSSGFGGGGSSGGGGGGGGGGSW